MEETAGESPAYVQAGYAFALGQAVHDRRVELGLSQTGPTRRAGMTQQQISHIKGGDSVPALALLTRLAKALDASLTAHRSPLTAHRSPLTAHRSPLTAHRSPLTLTDAASWS
ncbi:helix-turn-helix domain-containing protein [Streptomyces sp. NPDC058357]|uniref:helix-turn-helix domain-containing protein n=1 Tax=unclassified Streptomyces TaxID=2593676 RepID=UPI003667859C